ncbi:Rha family transcriptional regulator [Pseudomonas citronellolis]|uniref:Rha family transcriptional regulator n=1 Tax=Pseudomonas citronellolis TaxID=53408 RepID=UPI00264A0908|nr:Rha family transcriptional regulator [Pseudomonas citronellolis]MDN6874080.1 Rha family transcriptional regulator [Pseudomonas citronellolis]
MQALEKASPVQVELVDGQITTTSLDVAAHFKKRHDTVLRAIRLLECSAEFTARNFAVSEYTDSTGRKLKQFRMTRDGFAFLAMGFTGKEAAKWKEAYINAFNRLEQELRKHDSVAADTIVNELIGMTEVNVIKGLIRDKAKVIPIDRRRGFQLSMHNRLHTRFNVPRVELIPAAQFDSACNFIAAYALEGEWLPSQEKPGAFVLDQYAARYVDSLIHYTYWVCYRWDQGIGSAVKALNPKFHAQTWEFFQELRNCAEMFERTAPELVAYFRSHEGGALRPQDCIATGRPAGHPAD